MLPLDPKGYKKTVPDVRTTPVNHCWQDLKKKITTRFELQPHYRDHRLARARPVVGQNGFTYAEAFEHFRLKNTTRKKETFLNFPPKYAALDTEMGIEFERRVHCRKKNGTLKYPETCHHGIKRKECKDCGEKNLVHKEIWDGIDKEDKEYVEAMEDNNQKEKIFFSPAQRLLLVKHILAHTRFDRTPEEFGTTPEEQKNYFNFEFGFERLLELGVYKAVFPLHEGLYDVPDIFEAVKEWPLDVESVESKPSADKADNKVTVHFTPRYSDKCAVDNERLFENGTPIKNSHRCDHCPPPSSKTPTNLLCRILIQSLALGSLNTIYYFYYNFILFL